MRLWVFTLCSPSPEIACFLQTETCLEGRGLHGNVPGEGKFIFLPWYKNQLRDQNAICQVQNRMMCIYDGTEAQNRGKDGNADMVGQAELQQRVVVEMLRPWSRQPQNKDCRRKGPAAPGKRLINKTPSFLSEEVFTAPLTNPTVQLSCTRPPHHLVFRSEPCEDPRKHAVVPPPHLRLFRPLPSSRVIPMPISQSSDLRGSLL